MVRRCCIDRSGLGRQFAERAQKKFGSYRVEGVDFTQGSKEELAYPVRLAFEDRAVRVPFSNAIRADLRGVRKLVTSSGNTRFAGERNAYGHCDRFWALALALYAARQPATGAITSVEGIKIGSLDVARRRQFIPRTLGQGVFTQRY
jgi:phage FluMu gp28-like protein